MPIQFFFSNSIEALTHNLADEIARHGDPFDPLTIIVPNPYVQKWIQLKIAERNGIFMNVTFRFLNDGLWELLDYRNPDKKKPSLLDQKDIQLLLYHAIASINPQNEHCRLIRQYLFDTDNTKKSDYDYKIFQLSSRLARYFMEYELYRSDMIHSWMMGALNLNNDIESAQCHLYRTLFSKGGYRDSILKTWFTLPQYWNHLSGKHSDCSPKRCIIFGESHLSPFHASMIFELGKNNSIVMYQINPCSEFWEDIPTPGEERWQRIRSIPIEETQDGSALFSDENENPLLKLWGKTGRETIKLLSVIEEAGSRDGFCTSHWIAPKQNQPASTTLAIVQDQILRRSTWIDPDARINQDTTIQIASCTELYREVEAVFNSILYNLERDSTLRMTDIAIMVPDMALYGPVIHSIFSREPRRLSYSIIDSTAITDSLFAQAVVSLIEIAAGSFTRSEVISLVRNPCFYKAHAMTLDDIMDWLSWVEKLNIYRGFEKNEALDPEQNLFTWRQGLLRLRYGRIMETRASSIHEGRFLDFNNIIPFSDIASGDQRLIDTFNDAIELLHVKTKGLGSLEASPLEWVNHVKTLIAEFLTIPADRPDETNVYSSLMEDLNRFAILEQLTVTNERPLLSITALKEFIIDALTGITSAQGSYLTSGINISALVPQRHIPFKIVYIMGMQEGLFPGPRDLSTLNLMTQARKIGDTTRPDINRYHFLEILLAAREKLYITYISKDLQKDQDFNPNSVIGQLITYVSNHVVKNTFNIITIPPSGSSIDYLRHGPAFIEYSDLIQADLRGSYQPVNYSESDRLIMLNKLSRLYSLDERVAIQLSDRLQNKTPDFSIPRAKEATQPVTASVSFNDIRSFLMNPAESALRWHLSIYDTESDDRAVEATEPFFSVYPSNHEFIINSLTFALRSKNATDLKTYMGNYYRHLKLMGFMPIGAFSDIDYNSLQADVQRRFCNGHNLLDFILARNSYTWHQAVSIGPNKSGIVPDKFFPSIQCPVTDHDLTITVELSGSLPAIWKNPETGDSETLVMTNSSKPSVLHLILPFIFYVAAASNYNADFGELIGSGSFTIHVSHQKGISSYPFKLTESESRHYLHSLLKDFLNAENFDLLPIPILSDKRIIHIPTVHEDPDEEGIAGYRQTLVDMIDDDAEKMYPLYRPMALLDLVEPEVPADAYIKVRNRFGILFTSFIGSDHSDE